MTHTDIAAGIEISRSTASWACWPERARAALAGPGVARSQ